MLALIQRMYAVEPEAKGAELDAEKRGDPRREQTQPILAETRAMPDELAPQSLPRSDLGCAIGYANNQWNALVRFADDGELAIDNNNAERGMRDVAVGRKNWLFTGSREGGRFAALFYSLINSCKLQKLDPFEYLRDVIDHVSTHPAIRGAELTPRSWKATRAQSAR